MESTGRGGQFGQNGQKLHENYKIDILWVGGSTQSASTRGNPGYCSFFEYNMDNMGKYLETLEKKQEIMQKKLPTILAQQGQSVGNFL